MIRKRPQYLHTVAEIQEFTVGKTVTDAWQKAHDGAQVSALCFSDGSRLEVHFWAGWEGTEETPGDEASVLWVAVPAGAGRGQVPSTPW